MESADAAAVDADCSTSPCLSQCSVDRAQSTMAGSQPLLYLRVPNVQRTRIERVGGNP